MRLAVVGDVHGHHEELAAIVRRVEAHQVDRIILLGDLVDRGPNPHECVKLARTGTFVSRSGRLTRLETVLGNHEDAYVRAWRGLPKPGKTEVCFPENDTYFKEIPFDDMQWMDSLPVVIEEPRLGVLCLHGGIDPRMQVREDLDDRVLRVRYLTAGGHPVPGFGKFAQASGGRHWSDSYDGRFGFVVYGHESWAEPRLRDHSLGLDGEGRGCIHAAILTNERSGLRVATTLTESYRRPVLFSTSTDRRRSLTRPLNSTFGWVSL